MYVSCQVTALVCASFTSIRCSVLFSDSALLHTPVSAHAVPCNIALLGLSLLTGRPDTLTTDPLIDRHYLLNRQ